MKNLTPASPRKTPRAFTRILSAAFAILMMVSTLTVLVIPASAKSTTESVTITNESNSEKSGSYRLKDINPAYQDAKYDRMCDLSVTLSGKKVTVKATCEVKDEEFDSFSDLSGCYLFVRVKLSDGTYVVFHSAMINITYSGRQTVTIDQKKSTVTIDQTKSIGSAKPVSATAFWADKERMVGTTNWSGSSRNFRLPSDAHFKGSVTVGTAKGGFLNLKTYNTVTYTISAEETSKLISNKKLFLTVNGKTTETVTITPGQAAKVTVKIDPPKTGDWLSRLSFGIK